VERAGHTIADDMSAILDPLQNRSPRGDDDEVARLRVPPHSVEAEQSVLGGLLLDNLAWDRAGDLLTDSDFYRYEHRLIYAGHRCLGRRQQAG
jgi:replicative DNA helicase